MTANTFTMIPTTAPNARLARVYQLAVYQLSHDVLVSHFGDSGRVNMMTTSQYNVNAVTCANALLFDGVSF